MKKVIARADGNIYDMFHLPLLNIIAHQKLHDLQEEITIFERIEYNDTWCLLGDGAKFSTKKVYNATTENYDTSESSLDIWKTCCVSRQKFFA
jgi:hypothetical protein